MPRKKSSGMIADVLSSAEQLRNTIASLQSEIRDKAKDLALAIVNQPVKKRGRPPKKPGRPRGKPRGRPRGRPKGRPRGRPTKAEMPSQA